MEITFSKVGFRSGVCISRLKPRISDATPRCSASSIYIYAKNDMSTIETQRQMEVGFVEISYSIFFVI